MRARQRDDAADGAIDRQRGLEPGAAVQGQAALVRPRQAEIEFGPHAVGRQNAADEAVAVPGWITSALLPVSGASVTSMPGAAAFAAAENFGAPSSSRVPSGSPNTKAGPPSTDGSVAERWPVTSVVAALASKVRPFRPNATTSMPAVRSKPIVHGPAVC